MYTSRTTRYIHVYRTLVMEWNSSVVGFDGTLRSYTQYMYMYMLVHVQVHVHVPCLRTLYVCLKCSLNQPSKLDDD